MWLLNKTITYIICGAYIYGKNIKPWTEGYLTTHRERSRITEDIRVNEALFIIFYYFQKLSKYDKILIFANSG